MTGYRPVLSRRGFRLAALIAAAACVLAIAAGAFVLSYPGVRALALAAGVTPSLARFYPPLLDAVLVVACAAAVTLRGALLRGFAWLAAGVVIGAVAAADTVHAMSITVPQRPLEATIAVVPWAALLVGLTLLDAMVRLSGPGRKAAAAGPGAANDRASGDGSAGPAAEPPAGATVVPLGTLLQDPPTPAAARQVKASASQARASAGQPPAAESAATAPESVPAPRTPERNEASDGGPGSLPG